MPTYTFAPNHDVVRTFPGVHPIAAMEKEQGVYSATPEFVRTHCGDIARSILDAVPGWYYARAEALKLYVNCDVRIHRLYPSDYPAYPGWHCDGEFRETYFSQPDLARIQVHEHLIATASTHEDGISNTEFLLDPYTFESQDLNAGHGLWQQVNDVLVQTPNLRIQPTQDGQLVRFDSWTLHRAAPARVRGWRLFFRMSMWHKPNLGDGGMVTKQEQVYKYVGHAGW